ncbi:MAG: glucose 1-dehydrogenase [Candidatus Latescibacteria bacterium]|nr:glucose 1-dehydrogenase [Candidatus Latescibacterota bacterium]
MRLKDKVAIVTGGANGIGRATVELFARAGAKLVVADRDTRAGKECVAQLEAGGSQALLVPADVSSDTDVATLVNQTTRRWGGLDILVNCAGVDISGSVVDTEPERWQRVLDVNLASAYRTCRFALPHLIERGGGSIVNIASLQGMYGWPRYAAYAASKAGLIGLTRQIAAEYADHNIRVNSISPGGIATQLRANSDQLEPRFAHDPGAPPPAAAPAPPPELPRLRRAGLPEDVAWAALFLASEEAAYITGHNLVVGGVLSVAL